MQLSRTNAYKAKEIHQTLERDILIAVESPIVPTRMMSDVEDWNARER